MKTKNILILLFSTSVTLTFSFTDSVQKDNPLITATDAKCEANCCPIVDVECGTAGPRACKVKIEGKICEAHRDSMCTTPLTTNQTAPIPTECE